MQMWLVYVVPSPGADLLFIKQSTTLASKVLKSSSAVAVQKTGFLDAERHFLFAGQ